MRINTRKLVFCLVSIFLLVCNTTALAGLSARTVGLGDEFVALTGSEALYGNPAAVNATDDKFNLEMNMGGSFWNNLLMNNYIDEATKDKLLARLNDSGFVFNTEGNLGGKLTIGPVTGFADMKELAMVRLSSDLATLLLKGNEIGEEYSIDGTSGFGAGYLDTGLNLSLKMPEKIAGSKKVYLGMTYHVLAGMVGQSSGTGSIQVGYDENDEPIISGNSGEFTVIYPDVEDGSNIAVGSAVDLGIYTEIDETYSLGISVMNIGGKLTVDEARYSKYGMLYEDQDNDGKEEWNFSDEPEEGLVPGGLVVKLPLIIRLGGKMKVGKSLFLLANYTNTQYPEEIFGSPIRDNKFAVAAEWTILKFLPLRVGANYSTLENNLAVTGGMGLHLGPLQADLGISDLTGFFNQSKGISGALSARIEF